jgi:C_GCAxxG_C_C family probable redox protein
MRFKLNIKTDKANAPGDMLIARIRDRALYLYQTRQMLCAEAVLAALNQELDGGLSDAQITTMAAPFSVALGESGCLCGALSGAVMASGLLLGRAKPIRRRKHLRDAARHLHDTFRAVHGSTCCRVLSRHVKNDPPAHFRYCADLTAQAAEMAARVILDERPELVTRAGNGFSNRQPSPIGAAWIRLVNLFSG